MGTSEGKPRSAASILAGAVNVFALLGWAVLLCAAFAYFMAPLPAHFYALAVVCELIRGLRGASALRALRSTSRYASTSKLIETELSPSGVLTISFHNEKKLNAWTQSLMKQMAAEISAADTRDDVRGVVLTGGGAYLSLIHI